MKKLLLILLCVPLITLFNSCSSGGDVPPPNNTPTLQSTIVDQIWELKTEEYRFNLHNNGELYEKDLICDEFSLTGWWSLDYDELTLTRQEGPLEISETITVTSFSANEIKFNVFTDSTTIIEEVYISVEPVIRGCMDSVSSSNYNPNALCDDGSCIPCIYGCMQPTALNYNTTATCDDGSCISNDMTYIPDGNFESYLEENGMGNEIDNDNYVATENISGVTMLFLDYQNISDLTGIEDFTALTELSCRDNQLTSLDVSNNTALTYLNCGDNQLTSLDVSNNTALTYLRCDSNQLSSLDVSQNPDLFVFYCWDNQLTSLDVSKITNLAGLNCSNNQLTSLVLGQNLGWEVFSCSNNPNLYCITALIILILFLQEILI